MKCLARLLLMTVFVAACAGTSSIKQTEQTQAVTAEDLLDESFDPQTIDDFALPSRAPAEGAVRSVTAEELLQMAASPSSEGSEEIEGYRVQLISTRNEEEARAVLRNAVLSFNEQVYREFHDPYYKIRVGDFKSRHDAARLQELAVQLGFKEAWVVRSMVKKSIAENPVHGEIVKP